MPKIQQTTDVVPPSVDDKEGLSDFSAGVQGNLQDLFDGAHAHDVLGAVPADTIGSLGDIELVDDGTNQYLYVRFKTGWKRFVPA